MPEAALLITPTTGTALIVPVPPAIGTDAKIIPGPWIGVSAKAVAHGTGSEDEARWLPTASYEAILADLTAESASQAIPWEPDTPGQAAGRTEITEALFDEQAAIMTRGDDD